MVEVLEGLALYESAIREAISGSPTLMAEANTDQEGLRLHHMTEDIVWIDQQNGHGLREHFPLIVLGTIEFGLHRDVLGPNSVAQAAGSVGFDIFRQSKQLTQEWDPEAYRDARDDYVRFLGKVMHDIERGAGLNSQIDFRKLDIHTMPHRSHEPAEGANPAFDYWQAGLVWEFSSELSTG